MLIFSFFQAAIDSYEKEAEARTASENLRSGLLEELERATQEIKHLNDQVISRALVDLYEI